MKSVALIILASLAIHSVAAAVLAAPLLCEPGEVYFEDNFTDPDSVLDRWFFREFWTVSGGALVRSELPAKNQRVFIKKPVYRDCIITLDFAFRGAKEIRVMTGSSGHYNAVVTIWPHGFRVFTAKDDSGPFLPTPHGECALELAANTMHTLSLEFFGDELVAQIGGKVIIARHPILDRERSYFAFQVDGPSAAFDRVKISHAVGRKASWDAQRESLLAIQDKRPWVSMTPTARRKDLEMITRDRLFRTDAKYRELVDGVASAKAAEKEAYPAVFKSLKERKKVITSERDRLLAEDPEFKPARSSVHVARRAEDAFLKAKFPDLSSSPEAQFALELAKCRRDATAGDPAFAKLLAATAASEAAFTKAYPKIHITDEALIAEGRAARAAAHSNPGFKALIKATGQAVRTEKAYVYEAEPRLQALSVKPR